MSARSIVSGIERVVIPVIGLGTWKISNALCEDLVYNSLKAGIRHIDCASIYGNEKEVGNGLTKAFLEGVCKREDVFVTSKLWNDSHGSDNVKAACKQSLDKLGLKYLDLYLIHFPKCFGRPITLMETWRAMESLVHEGSCKNIGVSNFTIQLLTDLLVYADIPPVINQVEMHPYLIQKNLRTFCSDVRIGVTAYSPFGGLSYVDMNLVNDGELLVLQDPVIKAIADKHKATPAQVILRWATQIDSNVNVIVKSTSEDRIKENLESQNLMLTEDDLNAISKLDKHRRYNTAIWDDGSFTFDS